MLNIRNFCIIAHVDHGKSTLADRILEKVGAIPAREMTAQVLDSMDLERERGITIKAKALRLNYKNKSGEEYQLNLIDTPGHVDFSYEVYHSLAAAEGVLLVVDASQGVEAQTLANYFLSKDRNMTIIPVINKIDLSNADTDRTKKQLIKNFGFKEDIILPVSAKYGNGVDAILDSIVSNIPYPEGKRDAPLKALVFDSNFDTFRGVVVYVRVVDGVIKKGDKIVMMSNGTVNEVDEVGIFTPKKKPIDKLSAGEVGYIIAGIKTISDVKIGETVTLQETPAQSPLPGYKDVKPMVFCGLYPISNEDYKLLEDALNKLKLNDASFIFEPESSEALGFGFRCGFLGLLHMEIIQERLEREYNLNLIASAPNVIYKINTRDGKSVYVDNPSRMPAPDKITTMEEPYVKMKIISPSEFVGSVMKTAQDRRGIFKDMSYIDELKVILLYELPFSEVASNFYDKIKSCTRGYASVDYEHIGYRESRLVKLDILVGGEVVDALSCIVHFDNSYYKGSELAKKLKELIPRQQYEVAIQAAIGSRIISRETVRPMRKDVTAKCYGGDITRKRKLLEIQKEGKKRLKQIGRVQIPQEAFLAVLKMD